MLSKEEAEEVVSELFYELEKRGYYVSSSTFKIIVSELMADAIKTLRE